jgi:two-component system nitrogen regulation response regulator NtrX
MAPKTDNGVITANMLPSEITSKNQLNIVGINKNILSMPLRSAREEFEKEYLLAQLARFEGNISKTAEFIGMERSAFHRKIKNLEIYNEKNDDKN